MFLNQQARSVVEFEAGHQITVMMLPNKSANYTGNSVEFLKLWFLTGLEIDLQKGILRLVSRPRPILSTTLINHRNVCRLFNIMELGGTQLVSLKIF